MKINFWESEHGTSFELTPETPEEVGQLFRMVNNSVAEKPQMYLSFGQEDKDVPGANIWIKKLKPQSNKVKTSIQNYTP
jgi:hypothetical protein